MGGIRLYVHIRNMGGERVSVVFFVGRPLGLKWENISSKYPTFAINRCRGRCWISAHRGTQCPQFRKVPDPRPSASEDGVGRVEDEMSL